MMAAFEEMRAYSTAADTNITTKILTKKQVARLGQIDLQRRGPMAVMSPDIALKLNIGEDQMAQMQEVQAGSNELRNVQRQAQRQQFQQFQTPNGGFDRAAMQAFRDSPQGKAQGEQQQKSRDQLQNQTIAAIGKLLSKKQKATFLALQGKPFDLTKLTTDPNAAPATPPAAATAATAATTKAAATTTTAKVPSKTSAKKKATAKRSTASN